MEGVPLWILILFVCLLLSSSYQAEEDHNITLEWTFTTKPDTSISALKIRCRLITDQQLLTLYFLYDGVEVSEFQDESFSGRVQSDKDALREGRIRLQLSRLRTEDSGLYMCDVDTGYGRGYNSCRVTVSASTPIMKVMSNVSSRLVLQCESAGWYPEPELLWLDGEGNLLSAGPTETLRGPDDLYTVSSRVTVEKRHSNNITCRVQQRNTNQSRETHIHVPGNNDSHSQTISLFHPHHVLWDTLGQPVALVLLAVVES
uniref:Ig-like domain-containing protein n=1 Tax=Haplochromis burtoni TaxID=8153 RepID=A0A3Q3CC61_HAPBU